MRVYVCVCYTFTFFLLHYFYYIPWHKKYIQMPLEHDNLTGIVSGPPLLKSGREQKWRKIYCQIQHARNIEISLRILAQPSILHLSPGYSYVSNPELDRHQRPFRLSNRIFRRLSLERQIIDQDHRNSRSQMEDGLPNLCKMIKIPKMPAGRWKYLCKNLEIQKLKLNDCFLWRWKLTILNVTILDVNALWNI